MSYYTADQLSLMGFKSIGERVFISRKSSIYNSRNISIGSDVRIDDFAVLSAGEGGIKIGNHVHIACFATLIGAGEIIVGDYSAIASRATILSSNDDYSGAYLTGVTFGDESRNVFTGDVMLLGRTALGVGCVVLPDVILSNCTIGALSLVRSGTRHNNEILVGTPAKPIKERSELKVSLPPKPR